MTLSEKLFNGTPGQTVLPLCTECGALVGDIEVHENWHNQGLSEQKRGPGRPPKASAHQAVATVVQAEFAAKAAGVETPKEWADRELGAREPSPVGEHLAVDLGEGEQIVVPILHGGKTRHPTPVVVDL